jgi:hypothetical protein
MGADKILPRTRLVIQVGQGSNDAVLSPAGVLSGLFAPLGFHFRANRGRPGISRCLEPSNFLVTSLRYQSKMVSS